MKGHGRPAALHLFVLSRVGGAVYPQMRPDTKSVDQRDVSLVTRIVF
jgi:hypothetical protein